MRAGNERGDAVNAKLAARQYGKHCTVATIASDEIAALTYQLWNERGRPIGSPDEDWFWAEAELSNRNEAAAAA